VGIRAHGELNDNFLKQRLAAGRRGARPDKITTREISNREWMPNVIDSDQSHFPLRTSGVANSPRARFVSISAHVPEMPRIAPDEVL
jgi:hypothetical protein